MSYHGWTYDLQGKLTKGDMKSPYFDLSQNGLTPCHVRVEGGYIFVNLASESQPPPFDGQALRQYAQRFAIADLKVGARGTFTVKANWKLLVENFVECYHCGPSHQNLVNTHNWDYRLTQEERAFRIEELRKWVGERPGGWWSYEAR